jgi:hypothetical protein
MTNASTFFLGFLNLYHARRGKHDISTTGFDFPIAVAAPQSFTGKRAYDDVISIAEFLVIGRESVIAIGMRVNDDRLLVRAMKPARVLDRRRSNVKHPAIQRSVPDWNDVFHVNRSSRRIITHDATNLAFNAF